MPSYVPVFKLDSAEYLHTSRAQGGAVHRNGPPHMLRSGPETDIQSVPLTTVPEDVVTGDHRPSGLTQTSCAEQLFYRRIFSTE